MGEYKYEMQVVDACMIVILIITGGIGIFGIIACIVHLYRMIPNAHPSKNETIFILIFHSLIFLVSIFGIIGGCINFRRVASVYF